jgi:hypothetical protein
VGEIVTDAAAVDQLQPGDHACLTFSDADERLDIVATFVRDGLERGDKVICLTDSLAPPAFTGELARRGLRLGERLSSGQLEVVASLPEFVAAGSFNPDRIVERLHARIDYPGLRIAADMCWALRPVGGLQRLVAFETEVTRLLAAGQTTAVCQYDRECFDAVTLASVNAAHSRTVAAVTYYADAILRICRQHLPPGIRIAGELDYRGVEPLNQALGESIRLDTAMELNLRHLRFVDVAAGGAIIEAALAMDSAQRMTVVCRPTVDKVLRALGADRVPGLHLVVRDVD